MEKSTVFVGRKPELEKLNALFNQKRASIVVIKGRRRIGKSRLVNEFAKDKRFLSFSGLAPAPNMKVQSQLDRFAQQLAKQTKKPFSLLKTGAKRCMLFALKSTNNPRLSCSMKFPG